MAKTKSKTIKKPVKYETIPLITVGAGFNTTLINVRRNIDSLIAQYGESAQLVIQAEGNYGDDDGSCNCGPPYIEYSIKVAKVK